MDERVRALERLARLGDREAKERLGALERRVVPPEEPALEYGLVISGHGVDRRSSRLRRTIQLVAELTGRSEAEATDMCRASVVPVLRRVTREEAEAAERRFQALGVMTRVTVKKRR